MPELPDLELYLHALRPRLVGAALERIAVLGPSLLRSVEPEPETLEGRAVTEVRRVGKRVAIGLDGGSFLVVHLMIAGRLRWWDASSPPGRPTRIEQARLRFDSGTLGITEAGGHHRATLHLVRDAAGLTAMDPGGLEPLEADLDAFGAALRRESRTLKRVLTSPSLFGGIGNAYSDEILHAARLSPLQLTGNLGDEEVARLHVATQETLRTWTDRLRVRAGTRFPGPGTVTAFRPEMAVHGRFGKPCPACGTTVMRIVRGTHETNYCPRCQTGGRVLADRSLSRLMKGDWPDRIEAWEADEQRTRKDVPE